MACPYIEPVLFCCPSPMLSIACPSSAQKDVQNAAGSPSAVIPLVGRSRPPCPPFVVRPLLSVIFQYAVRANATMLPGLLVNCPRSCFVVYYYVLLERHTRFSPLSAVACRPLFCPLFATAVVVYCRHHAQHPPYVVAGPPARPNHPCYHPMSARPSFVQASVCANLLPICCRAAGMPRPNQYYFVHVCCCPAFCRCPCLFAIARRS